MIINLTKEIIPERFSVFTLVDGSFDPLHHGHIKYFEEAFNIGFPVSCLLAPDSYTSKKHRILLPAEDRAIVLSSLRQIENVIIGSTSTEASILQIKPKIFFKGGDWCGKLPAPIVTACQQVGAEIRFGSNPIASSSNLVRKMTNEPQE